MRLRKDRSIFKKYKEKLFDKLWQILEQKIRDKIWNKKFAKIVEKMFMIYFEKKIPRNVFFK